MSKKIKIDSCFGCPHHSQYEHDGSTYDTTMAMCSAYADGDTIKGRVFEDMQIPNYIWEECPLEGYHASFTSREPIISRRTVTNAFGLKERSPLREEYENHVSIPEQVAPAPVEMKEFVAMIEYSSYTEYYYAPDGNSHHSHPSKLNEFMQRVGESGGNIISMQIVSDQLKYSVHYQVPAGTFPIPI